MCQHKDRESMKLTGGIILSLLQKQRNQAHIKVSNTPKTFKKSKTDLPIQQSMKIRRIDYLIILTY